MSKKEITRDILLVILGNFIVACGVVFFIIPNSILSGGVAGIIVAIEPVIQVNSSILITVFTIILFVIGGFFLGKGFMLKTALSSVLYPIFIALLSGLSNGMRLTDEPILASIYGGVLIGAGVGLVFRTGASTGGMDIPPLILQKYIHVPLATLVLITDALTVLLGVAIHGVEPALIGIISVWVCAYTIDKTMMFGSLDAKSIMIISEKYEEMLVEIAQEIDRGATLFEATGTYTREKKSVIMVVLSRKQFPALNRIVQHIDPGAFVIVSDVNEVHGEGFTFEGE